MYGTKRLTIQRRWLPLDLSNVAIDFEFKIVNKPIRTAMGTLKLRVCAVFK